MGLAGTALDIFIAYKFIQLLVVPFDKTEAYKLGIINANGDILKKRSQLTTSQEKKAYPSIFYTMVWKIKKLLEKLPFGKSKIASIAAAAYFLKEHVESIGGDFTKIEDALMEHLHENGYSQLLESRHSSAIENGQYLIENEVIELNEYTDPIDTVLGVPIYKVDNKVFTLGELQRID
jgi:hypothetical protein